MARKRSQWWLPRQRRDMEAHRQQGQNYWCPHCVSIPRGTVPPRRALCSASATFERGLPRPGGVSQVVLVRGKEEGRARAPPLCGGGQCVGRGGFRKRVRAFLVCDRCRKRTGRLEMPMDAGPRSRASAPSGTGPRGSQFCGCGTRMCSDGHRQELGIYFEGNRKPLKALLNGGAIRCHLRVSHVTRTAVRGAGGGWGSSGSQQRASACPTGRSHGGQAHLAPPLPSPWAPVPLPRSPAAANTMQMPDRLPPALHDPLCLLSAQCPVLSVQRLTPTTISHAHKHHGNGNSATTARKPDCNSPTWSSAHLRGHTLQTLLLSTRFCAQRG